ncbi:MAG TPA: methylated-DNA--[protein]-cysteine S-methyltransferase [Solirubrobacterales bacterium]|jgi:methylated-DNA-[protein]-cysteine S-methyltransferase|nr:methylated-DNA--[protein]-cysteine S-methyltransferase [Solirubrobacterales bacterium]
MTATHTAIDSPIGELTLVASDGVLSGIYFPGHWHMPAPEVFGARSERGFEQAQQQLGEYFAGQRTEFELTTAVTGEEFQRRVWELIDRIPYGQTTTYGEMAQELGDPALAREVGAAVGRNPLSIVVPCHRVVGKDGKLTGYAGGLERKRFLLELEGAGERIEAEQLQLAG